MVIWRKVKYVGRNGDYITLGKAVSNFNKKIRELQQEENKLYLPEERNYKDLRNEIVTRSQLNNIINSLKRFSREGAEEVYTTKGGKEITVWENRENQILKQIAMRRLNADLKVLEVPRKIRFFKTRNGKR